MLAHTGSLSFSSLNIKLYFNQPLVQSLLPAEATVILLGDGEYDNVDKIQWLEAHTRWHFVVRTACSSVVHFHGRVFALKALPIAPDKCLVLEEVLITQAGYGPLLAMVYDDAPEFNYLAAVHWLCWVHDGRHYTKLTPFLPYHQETLTAFRKEYWDFYHRLVACRLAPSANESEHLRSDFHALAKPTTGP